MRHDGERGRRRIRRLDPAQPRRRHSGHASAWAGAAVVLSAALLAAAPAAARRAGQPGLRATTARFVFTLEFGMPEQMWTRAQAAKMHPKTGELILAGAMSGGMPMGDGQRHLEVHIYSRTTGIAVAGAHPAISLRDVSVANAKTVSVPVAEMEGIAAGPTDLHYGNNVSVVGGQLYLVTVTLDGERALLEARAPM
jgi:hypothetical protein